MLSAGVIRMTRREGCRELTNDTYSLHPHRQVAAPHKDMLEA